MNTWLLFALLGPILWGMGNVMDAVLRRHFVKSDFALSWFVAATRLPLVPLLLWWGGVEFPGTGNLIWMLVGGFLWTAPMWFYFKAIDFEEPSRVALLIQVTPVFTLIIAFFMLGEQLTGAEVPAFLFLILGGLFASLRRWEEKWRISRALLLITFTTVIWALSDVLFKKFEPAFSNFYTAFAFYMLGSFLFSTLFLLKREKRRKMLAHFSGLPARAWALLAAVQIAGITGSLAFAYALTIGKASLTTVLIGLQPLSAFAFGLLLAHFLTEVHREELSRQSLLFKALSFILIVTGLVALSHFQ
ncbi:MAG: DMT family transporter [Candidatus Peregrinibacteria bacterium]